MAQAKIIERIECIENNVFNLSEVKIPLRNGWTNIKQWWNSLWKCFKFPKMTKLKL